MSEESVPLRVDCKATISMRPPPPGFEVPVKYGKRNFSDFQHYGQEHRCGSHIRDMPYRDATACMLKVEPDFEEVRK